METFPVYYAGESDSPKKGGETFCGYIYLLQEHGIRQEVERRGLLASGAIVRGLAQTGVLRHLLLVICSLVDRCSLRAGSVVVKEAAVFTGRPIFNPFSAFGVSVIVFLFLFHLFTDDVVSGIFNTFSE